MSPKQSFPKHVVIYVDQARVTIPVSDDLWRLFNEQFAQPATRNTAGSPSRKRKQTLINLLRCAYVHGRGNSKSKQSAA